jgi:hypothetical protein
MSPLEVVEAVFPEAECHANEDAERMCALMARNRLARLEAQFIPDWPEEVDGPRLTTPATPAPNPIRAMAFLSMMLGGRSS